PEHPCGDEHPQASDPRTLRAAGPGRLPSFGLISLIPPLPAGHDCQPARQARSMRGFSREPERNNLAVLSTGSAAERPAAAEIGGRPHQFEMRPMLSAAPVRSFASEGARSESKVIGPTAPGHSKKSGLLVSSAGVLVDVSPLEK